MKIIFFGLGSIGTRHARILKEHFNHDLFAFRSGGNKQPNRLGIKEIYSWKAVKDLAPDVAFITNPTFLHVDTAIKCARLGINLFLEKPIGCTTVKLDNLINIVKEKRLTTYVAYCMRFHPVMAHLYKSVSKRKSMHARILNTSYLPEWRKGRDYRKVWSSHRDKGGGIILELSHEIDYSQYLFGDILEMRGMYGKVSNLDVKCEDYVDIIIRCKRGVVNLHMDFFSRELKREIEIDLGNSDRIKGNFIKNVVTVNKGSKKNVYRYKCKREDMYIRQLRYFFKNFKNKRMTNNLINANKLFRKIVSFEEADNER